jgi:hypothetical protein
MNAPEGDPMEARIARLEASVTHIESDIREIKGDLRSMLKFSISGFVLVGGGIVGLAGLMAKGFGWL